MKSSDNEKALRVTVDEILNKRFKETSSSGYDPDDVDEFLDKIAKTLNHYEKSFERYLTGINNFESISEKTSRQDAIIKKLQMEIQDLYNNGYGHQAMMRRVQQLEKNFQDRNAFIKEKWEEMSKFMNLILRKLEIY
ncbi:DivIVA domain-containing protein [Mycoplasmoides alvi]|uniref:DivIVA domain-containing protein n=1 Tax=Mycoplasmoides alvi TaxID=78580 RepID=UPI00051B8FC1|nr:DivIVA domain-containing protein [Mycoplasmoides alvi]